MTIQEEVTEIALVAVYGTLLATTLLIRVRSSACESRTVPPSSRDCSIDLFCQFVLLSLFKRSLSGCGDIGRYGGLIAAECKRSWDQHSHLFHKGRRELFIIAIGEEGQLSVVAALTSSQA